MISVAIAGAQGRMGGEVIRAVTAASDMEVVAQVDVKPLGPGWQGVGRPFTDLHEALEDTKPQVLVDFTIADAAFENALTALEFGVRPVIGTTGMRPDQLQRIGDKASEQRTGAFVAPNFALGVVLTMHFARIASRYFDSAEVIELHHDQKIDAPSGTGVWIAQNMANARGKPFRMNVPEKETLPGGRGAEYEGVRVHSVRLPGLVAHHEVLFGGEGQILTIRHDSMDRNSFMPGVLIAIHEVLGLDRLVVGLDNLLHLQ